ncbi:MAG: hypothetical protein IJM63_04355 [Solobacterium sp.]|nr:hypothetical protein [Solobacterium sp.]
MKMAEQVMDAMSMIDESYLRQSEEYKASSFAWKPVLSFAAVFVLICAVFFNIPRSGSSAPATNGFLSDNDGAVSEESVYEAENITVIYDVELLEYLETVSDDTAVEVIIEEIDTKASEVQADTTTGSETMDVDHDSVTTMTKAEILNFIAEEGKHYIFHLYTADESE